MQTVLLAERRGRRKILAKVEDPGQRDGVGGRPWTKRKTLVKGMG